MKKNIILLTWLLVTFLTFRVDAASPPKKSVHSAAKSKELIALYMKHHSNKELKVVKKKTLSMAGTAVPALIEVMKSSKYPDKNRWMATFLLGRIMGKKASPFIVKFLEHPNWVLRMASLKTLLALKEQRFAKQYGKALTDSSMVVRIQALENIRRLGLTNVAANVWAMLYDKKNYYSSNKSKKAEKRTNVIKLAVKTVGDLKFRRAKKPLLQMAQKDKYSDIFSEIDYSLTKILGKKSPQGDLGAKKRFWSRIALAEKTI